MLAIEASQTGLVALKKLMEKAQLTEVWGAVQRLGLGFALAV